MQRREFIKLFGGAAVATLGTCDGVASPRRGPVALTAQLSPAIGNAPTLLTAPIDLAGNWDHMLRGAVDQVVERMRHACLDGIRLLSDRQPTRLRVDEHLFGPPAVWLHTEESSTAWVIVHIGERAWSQLAYQFGHEFGHVMANSWQPIAKPMLPCQWIEEGLVEAFSIRGLGRLAASWKTNPPFAGDSAYGDSIADYRQNIIQRYSVMAEQLGTTSDTAKWFADNRAKIEASGREFMGPTSLIVLSEYERAPSCVEALGALNRWPGRSGIPIHDYFRHWLASCIELGASSELPTRLRETLGIT